MRSLHAVMQAQSVKTILIGLSILSASFPQASLAIDQTEASQLVKSQHCAENMTIEQILDQSIKSHSQRDIGWRTFQDEDYFDVERAVLVNKGMELRYRWRVAADGSITPQSHRAETLCSAGSPSNG